MTELIGTEPGTVICHICFPCNCEGEKRSSRFEEVKGVIDAASKPGGDLYVVGAAAAEDDCEILIHVSR